MKNLKNITLLLFITVIAMSCICKKEVTQEAVEKIGTTSNSVIVQPGYVAPSSTDNFAVDTAFVQGDDLTLVVTYGGGCKDHEFKAYAGNVYMKSMPPKLSLFVAHNANEDMCKALVKDTVNFDLTTIKYPGKEKDYSVVFTINNWEGNLTYKY